MTDLELKLLLGCKIVGGVGLVIGAWCFSKVQYYQGKIDARKEMISALEAIRIEVEEEIQSKKEEEA